MRAPDEPVRYMNRLTEEIEIEPVMGGGWVRFAYNTLVGRSLWGLLFNHKCASWIMGLYFDSSLSKRHIRPFIRDQKIDTTEIELPLRMFKSFNAFFTRKLKEGSRSFEPKKESLASPADGRLFVYPSIRNSDPIPIKGATHTLNQLCGENLPDGNYAVAIVRLCPADYHRFHFPCDAKRVGDAHTIRGKYHSVNPIAIWRCPNILATNARHVTTLKSNEFGIFRYIEVGAFGVGSIVQTETQITNDKMDEKGFFKFGGSTVILVFDSAMISFDHDLIENTKNGIETRVNTGNEIATATL